MPTNRVSYNNFKIFRRGEPLASVLEEIFILDLAPFASSTFQFVPTDSGHSSEVRKFLSEKLSLLNGEI